ncbi:transposase, partial [Planobispora siamensis]
MFLGSRVDLTFDPVSAHDMGRRFELTDEEWQVIAPLLPPMDPRRGGRWRDHRQVLNGIVWR